MTSFLQEHDGISVEYVTLPGWKSPITACKEFDELPENARKYVNEIEELVGVRGEKRQFFCGTHLVFF